jgi:hypothetical protein
MTEQKVHGNTRKAAEMALAKRLISRSSYEAILAGTLTLATARELGREGGPEARTSRGGQDEARTGPRSTRAGGTQGGAYCLCGCGETTRGGRFKPGHDARLYGELKRNLEKDPLLRNERFTEAQRAYAKERGLV